MLIPEDLTVKELKVECTKHSNCDTCKYEDSCAATDPSRIKIDLNYPKFAEQEIGILQFYNKRGFKSAYFNKHDSSINIKNTHGNLTILPVFLMLTIAKYYDYDHPLDIQQYLDWYESNHD